MGENNARQPLLIVGAGGHAKVVADAARLSGSWDIVGFVDELNAQREGEMFCGSPILAGPGWVDRCRAQGFRTCFVAIGDADARLRAGGLADAAGLALARVIHPSAAVTGDNRIGKNVFIGAHAVVNAGATLGDFAVINSAAVVEHDCTIGEAAHICPGAVLGGHARVGRRTWIGIGATVSDRITIGDNTTVGAGAVVVRDLPPGVIAYGNPARPQRETHP